ncbi:EamA-like transporter family protein [Candidatus Planktophila limnetica]|uniref:EamA-like transporter family protein n=1 Tax=Candidatus Planktophila limnetica TaxID=573600 RepID=A0A249LEP0_9ACTN|nr:DMT family transporter [Candidatus Planktophila limnetica]ASY27591.1 EamA-like transporter family protein [Candidatus Planktophila limnetica]
MGSLLALLSSALWGTADFFGGKLSKKYAPILVLGMTQAIGLLFGITLVLLSGELFGSNPPNAFGDGGYFFAGAIAGVTGYIGLICLYAGLSTGRMGVVSPISALSAVIPLTVALVTGEVLTTAQGIGVVIAMVGAFCASGPELSQGLSPKPIFLALGAAAGFGTAMTFMAIGSESSALMTMVMMRATTFIVTIFLVIRYRTVGNFEKSEIPVLLFIGVSDFLANLLLGVATNFGLVSLVMVLGSIYPIVTALLAFIILKERLHRVQYVGIVFAVAGVALISAS